MSEGHQQPTPDQVYLSAAQKVTLADFPAEGFILDIGGGFPVAYHSEVKSFESLARLLNAEIDRLFPKDIEILAEPGRFIVATAAALPFAKWSSNLLFWLQMVLP